MSDNLLAAISGALEGFNRAAQPYMQAKYEDQLATKRRQQQMQDDLALLPQRQAIESQYKRQDLDYQNQLAIDRSRAEYDQKLPIENRKLDLMEKRLSLMERLATQKANSVVAKQSTIPSSEIGKATLAQESIVNIKNARKKLFPDDTPQSFDRKIAMKSNLPLIGGSLPFSGDGQDIQRWLGNALAARQLISTGVAARPDETKALVSRFMANYGSDPHAFDRALSELERFYDNYLSNLSSKSIDNSSFDSNLMGEKVDDLDFMED